MAFIDSPDDVRTCVKRPMDCGITGSVDLMIYLSSSSSVGRQVASQCQWGTGVN